MFYMRRTFLSGQHRRLVLLQGHSGVGGRFSSRGAGATSLSSCSTRRIRVQPSPPATRFANKAAEILQSKPFALEIELVVPVPVAHHWAAKTSTITSFNATPTSPLAAAAP
jgi:hypothetical protein